MAQPAHGTSVTTEILATLPQAVDPLALSLNESPFPPLPAVRSALIHSIDAVNRYPEFLPGQLRRLVADRVGVDEEQVVLGAGASGVVMQVLHAEPASPRPTPPLRARPALRQLRLGPRPTAATAQAETPDSG